VKFRNRLLLFSLVVAALTALAVLLAGGAILRRSVSDRVMERLDGEIGVLADWLAREPSLLPYPPPAAHPSQGAASAPGSPESEFTLPDDFADRMGRTLHLRVTVIAADGRVIGDSARDGAALASEENHANRPEASLARSGIGLARCRIARVLFSKCRPRNRCRRRHSSWNNSTGNAAGLDPDGRTLHHGRCRRSRPNSCRYTPRRHPRTS
jgi:hypothetical protein